MTKGWEQVIPCQKWSISSLILKYNDLPSPSPSEMFFLFLLLNVLACLFKMMYVQSLPREGSSHSELMKL